MTTLSPQDLELAKKHLGSDVFEFMKQSELASFIEAHYKQNCKNVGWIYTRYSDNGCPITRLVQDKPNRADAHNVKRVFILAELANRKGE